MKHAVLIALGLALGGCVKDETISAFVPEGSTWQLVTLAGAPFSASATLEFPEPGRIAGSGPCNRYFGAQTVPYPWFNVDGVASTKRACPDLRAEGAYFKALQDATLAEVSGDTLILSNDSGPLLEFKRQD